jgi:hypothetical protein
MEHGEARIGLRDLSWTRGKRKEKKKEKRKLDLRRLKSRLTPVKQVPLPSDIMHHV